MVESQSNRKKYAFKRQTKSFPLRKETLRRIFSKILVYFTQKHKAINSAHRINQPHMVFNNSDIRMRRRHWEA